VWLMCRFEREEAWDDGWLQPASRSKALLMFTGLTFFDNYHILNQ